MHKGSVYIYKKKKRDAYYSLSYSLIKLQMVSIRRNNNILSLHEFLYRAQVRKVYRDLVRAIYKTHEKEDLMGYARHEFRIHDKETDLQKRRYLLNDGINKISKFMSLIGMLSLKS